MAAIRMKMLVAKRIEIAVLFELCFTADETVTRTWKTTYPNFILSLAVLLCQLVPIELRSLSLWSRQ